MGKHTCIGPSGDTTTLVCGTESTSSRKTIANGSELAVAAIASGITDNTTDMVVTGQNTGGENLRYFRRNSLSGKDTCLLVTCDTGTRKAYIAYCSIFNESEETYIIGTRLNSQSFDKMSSTVKTTRKWVGRCSDRNPFATKGNVVCKHIITRQIIGYCL